MFRRLSERVRDLLKFAHEVLNPLPYFDYELLHLIDYIAYVNFWERKFRPRELPILNLVTYLFSKCCEEENKHKRNQYGKEDSITER